jgi:Rrf2 family nitric oxide-sensitive transcriptional repressor
MYLGAHPGRLVSNPEMARKLHVSREHLMKSLQTLSGMGLVTAVRGRSGGFRLSGKGDEVRLGALVRSLEPSLAMAECFEPHSTCPMTGNCRLTGVLAEAQQSLFDTLDRYTLGDLLRAERPVLVQLEGRR